jgi:hypothetical protein
MVLYIIKGAYMTNKTKLIFGDDISYSRHSDFVDYGSIKIRSFDSLNGGIIKKILAYIYLFTVVTGVIFFLSR